MFTSRITNWTNKHFAKVFKPVLSRRITWIPQHPGYLLTGLVLLALLSITLLITPDPFQVLAEYWHFFFLGIGGAVAANSTGAGGGILFIPAFTSLGISETDALGTSIAIQCFGMTAGSISWLYSIHHGEHGGQQVISLTQQLLIFSGTPAIAGMLCGQYILPTPPLPVTSLFKYFSILFGCILLLVTLRKNPHRHTRYQLRRIDIPSILITCFTGGMITSWISIGAGEWIALLLFFLGYPTMVAVCVAVCISSLTVLSGIPYHLFITGSIVWKVLLFAAPAAILGGTVARFLAERLGPVRLKIFFATWILATGFAMPF